MKPSNKSIPMQIKPFSLRFTGECEHLEPIFQREYLQASIKHLRIKLVMAGLLFAVFGILDAFLIPEKKHLTWVIRYGFVCPSVLIVILTTYFEWGRKRIQPILTGIVIIAGSGIIFMIVVAPPPANYSYYAGLILVFIIAYTIVGFRFLWALLGPWILILLYEIAAVGMVETPVPVLINNNFFFVSANILGMLACYFFEHYARRDFLMARMLSEEQAKVRLVNRKLEQRVKERTAQLERLNRDLALEIQQRKQTETERIRLANQLKQTEKMEAVGSMAAGVAHDLNNILGGLVSYPELILMDIPADSPLRRPIETIKQSGDKAAAIVQDMLTLARRGVSDKSVVDPNRLIADYLASPECLTLKRFHPHIKLRSDLDPGLLSILASPVQLSKTVMNLVSNAAEALLVDGEVVVTTKNISLDQPLHGYETVAPGDYALVSCHT
ncbi:MAG: hypothetical protein CR984_03725 [Proteobacteria bacterium]|nr:MAG: hypothetical protein CR984_03725 [Pseudomonadota bacterium]